MKPTKKIRLAEFFKEEQVAPQQASAAPAPTKDSFLESLKQFNAHGQSIYGSKKLKEITDHIKSIVESAEQLTLTETDGWFDKVTVTRHMKQLKESYKTFEKTANEMGVLQQRLEACYEDIGKNLNNYWEVE